MDEKPKLLGRLGAGISKFYRSYLLARLFGRQKIKNLMKADDSPEERARADEASEPVDAVFLWKDDSDPEWVEKERRDLKEFDVKYYINQLQFFNPEPKPVLDELRYSLRSLETYFVDLGNVYIVTDGQRPSWLKKNHPRVKVVDIAEIIDDPAYLPSYNSQAIESYLYRIEGLSEHFIYLNDDFFLASKLAFSDFFTPDSKIKVRLGRGLSPKGDPENTEDGDVSAHKNSNAVLDARFKKEDRLTVMHRPYTLTKTLMKESLRQFPEEFHQTRKSRFRSTKDVWFAQLPRPVCRLLPRACAAGAAQHHGEGHVFLDQRSDRQPEDRQRAHDARARGFLHPGRPLAHPDRGVRRAVSRNDAYPVPEKVGVRGVGHQSSFNSGRISVRPITRASPEVR